MGGKGVAECMAVNPFLNPCSVSGRFNSFLETILVQMVAATVLSARID